MNAAEGSIRELKRGTGKKIEKIRSPKRLWDHLLELETLIMSNTACHIYQLKCEVPKTMISAETSDISLFCELEWYEWVTYKGNTIPHL